MTRNTKFVLLIMLVVLVYASAPYIAGMIASGKDVFTGIHAVAPGDINVYYAMINQAEHGAVVFRNVFSTETTAPVFFNPFWLIVGVFGSLFSLSPEWTFHVVRLVSGMLLILLLWRFCGMFFSSGTRRVTLITMLFAHGLGVYALILAPGVFSDPYRRPMDLWVSESSVLYSILHSAHFVVGTLLMIAGILLLITALERRTFRHAVYSGSCFLGLFSFHPFHIPTIWLFALVIFVGELVLRRMNRRRFLLLIIPMLISLPAVLWYAYTTITDPVASARAAQNINLIPGVWAVLLSYGFLLPLAVVGGAVWLQRSVRYRLIVWWAVAHFAVLFSPIFFNRRLSQGLDVPLALLAVAGGAVLLQWWKQHYPKRMPRWSFFPWGALVICAFGLSPLFFVAQDMSLIATRQRYAEIFYRPAQERVTYKTFIQMSDPLDSFFSGSLTGNFFAAQTLRHAYIAHSVETIAYADKLKNVREFFHSWDPEQRAAFLDENDLRWIIVRPEEFQYRAIVEETPGVHEAYTSVAARIYQFQLSE